jgi:hypothetical protein
MGVNSVYSFASTYGCTPGQIIHDATDRFKADINASREATNQQIRNIQANKDAQNRQWQEGQKKSGGGGNANDNISNNLKIYYEHIPPIQNNYNEDLSYNDKSYQQLVKTKGINANMFNYRKLPGRRAQRDKTEQEFLMDMKSIGTLMSIVGNKAIVTKLINHFANGTGVDYKGYDLSKAIESSNSTKSTITTFINKTKNYIKESKGVLNKAVKKIYESNQNLIGKISYSNFFNGLAFAIHSWTEIVVYISNYKIKNDRYSGTLEFVFVDHFGLDSGDIGELKDIILPFASWYILQHHDKYRGKYKPFKTVVSFKHQFSGRL